MKKILTYVTVVALLGFTACKKSKEAQLAELKGQETELQDKIATLEAELKAEGKTVAVEKKTVPVSVAAVQPDTFSHYLEVQGKAQFDQNVMVSPQVGGVLTSVRVQRGDRVTKGQTMATIDATVMEQNLAEVRTRLDLARIAYQKQKNLWDQQIGTEMQYLTAKSNYESLQRNLNTLQQQRSQFNVKAPISGVVDDVVPNAGEAVAPGMGMIRVVNSSNGKIVADVSEAYMAKVKKGDKAIIRFPDLNKEVEATVDVVSQFINPSSRTFTIELRPKNSKEIALRPNLMAVVRIRNYKNEEAIIVPVNLVQKDETSEYIYVARKQGDQHVAARQQITTGITYGGKVEVLEGLKPNDQIITAGYQNLNEGQPVVFSQVSSVN